MQFVDSLMKTVELVILVGIQASGKTTFYRRRLEGEYVHVSLDAWRGKGNVRGKEYRAILAGLRAAAEESGQIRGVVVDNTNTTAETRRRYFEYAAEFSRQAGCEVRAVAYFFDADLKSCLERNTRRPKDAPAGTGYFVPPAAIASFHRRLEPPTYAEGFAGIYRARITQDGQFEIHPVPRGQGSDRSRPSMDGPVPRR